MIFQHSVTYDGSFRSTGSLGGRQRQPPVVSLDDGYTYYAFEMSISLTLNNFNELALLVNHPQ